MDYRENRERDEIFRRKKKKIRRKGRKKDKAVREATLRLLINSVIMITSDKAIINTRTIEANWAVMLN